MNIEQLCKIAVLCLLLLSAVIFTEAALSGKGCRKYDGDCASCSQEPNCGYCGNSPTKGLCLPGSAAGSNISAYYGSSKPECPFLKWRYNKCLPSRVLVPVPPNGVVIGDYLNENGFLRVRIIAVSMSPAWNGTGLWIASASVVGTMNFNGTAGQQPDFVNFTNIYNITGKFRVSAAGLLKIGEYDNPSGLPYSCYNFETDSNGQDSTCLTKLTRKGLFQGANIEELKNQNVLGFNISSIGFTDASDSVLIELQHPNASFSCSFSKSDTALRNPFDLSCSVRAVNWNFVSRVKSSLAFFLLGAQLEASGSLSFSSGLLSGLSANLNGSFAVDPDFIPLLRKSNAVSTFSLGALSLNHTVVSVLNPNVIGKRQSSSSGYDSDVYLTGPSVLLGTSSSSNKGLKIGVGVGVGAAVLLVLIAILIIWQFPQVLPKCVRQSKSFDQ